MVAITKHKSIECLRLQDFWSVVEGTIISTHHFDLDTYHKGYELYNAFVTWLHIAHSPLSVLTQIADNVKNNSGDVKK